MSIRIGSNLLHSGERFLDERQMIAESKNDLLNWDFQRFLIPEGFEVYCNDTWYTYSSKNTRDRETGYFKKRGADITSELSAAIRDTKTTISSDVESVYQKKISSGIGLSFVDSVMSLRVKSSDDILGIDPNNNLSSTLKISSIVQPEDSIYAAQFRLVGKEGKQLGDTISVFKDRFLDKVEFIEEADERDIADDGNVVEGDPYLRLTFKLSSGAVKIQYIALKALIDVYTSGHGINVSEDNVISIKLDPESATTLTVGKTGLKLDDQKYARYSELKEHKDDKKIHVTTIEKSNWSSKLDVLLQGDYEEEEENQKLEFEDYHTGKGYKDFF